MHAKAGGIVGRIVELSPPAQAFRLWVVYDTDDKPLQLFKGTHNDALETVAKSYQGERKVGACREAVNCAAADVEFVTTLLHAEWLCSQFAFMTQMQAKVQPVRAVPALPVKH